MYAYLVIITQPNYLYALNQSNLACTCIVTLEQSMEVEFSLGNQSASNLLITPGTVISVTWSPESIIPVLIQDPNSYSVDIMLIRLDHESGTWDELATLGSGLPNTGTAQFTAGRYNQLALDVMSVALQVRVTMPPIDSRRKRAISGIVEQLSSVISRWSIALFYLPIIEELSGFQRSQCQLWCDRQEDGIGQRILDELREAGTPCPPLVLQARLQNSGLVEDTGFFTRLSNSFFHPGVETCFRSRQARYNFKWFCVIWDGNWIWSTLYMLIVHTKSYRLAQ